MIDYYTGFEGEPELRFEARSGASVLAALRIWSGYFDDLARRIPKEGIGWTGLARVYHLEQGFYVQSPWKVDELPAISRQWNAIDLTGADEITRQVHTAVAALMSQAVAQGNDVWIALD